MLCLKSESSSSTITKSGERKSAGYYKCAHCGRSFLKRLVEEKLLNATNLQPDMILLDLGLPMLNGIEAGKIIRERCPWSRIFFVTQNSDSEIRRTALGIGHGCVLKAEANCELVKTIAAALEIAGAAPNL